MPIQIKTEFENFTAAGGHGSLLMDLAESLGLQLNSSCAGKGICGDCSVKLEQGTFLVEGEQVTLAPGDNRSALSCHTKVISRDAEVRFPRTSLVEAWAKIDEDFSLPRVRSGGEAGSRTRRAQIRLRDPQDPESLWDQFRRAVYAATGVASPSVPLDLLQRLPALLEQGAGKITVTLGVADDSWRVIDVIGHEAGVTLGAAADLGTTTVVAMLVDLDEGKILKKASMYNQQIRTAEDVASRISRCRTPTDVSSLQRLLVEETVNLLIHELCQGTDARPEQISRLALSGNTVMTHLFLGLSPKGIGRAPFRPVANVHDAREARDVRVAIAPHGIVEVVPSIAGYVGGDITSNIYVAKLATQPEPSLLVDIGTNAEIVYSEGDNLAACSTAAGPAFEGYGLSHGCRAAAGAIEHIAFGAELHFELDVIGGGAPTGLCGSAIIDFIACGLRCGLINRMGRFDVPMLEAAGRCLRDDALCGRSTACVLVDAKHSGTGDWLFISESDLSEVLKAKAAIYAGMTTLLETQGKTFDHISQLCLAGGFARHIDVANAITIGLLPDIPAERFDVIGNGSLAGAFLALMQPNAMAAYRELVDRPNVIELNLVESFEANFIDALALPNLQAKDFPRVVGQLKDAAAGRIAE